MNPNLRSLGRRGVERRALALVLGLALRVRDDLLAHRPHVQIGVLAPAQATAVAQHVGGQTLGGPPPRLGLARAARAAAVVVLLQLRHHRALVVVGRDVAHGRVRFLVLPAGPRRAYSHVLLAELRAGSATVSGGERRSGTRWGVRRTSSSARRNGRPRASAGCPPPRALHAAPRRASRLRPRTRPSRPRPTPCLCTLSRSS